MIVAVDETGDANLSIDFPRFAVGALYLPNNDEAARIIERSRTRLNEQEHVFHFSADGPVARQVLAEEIDKSSVTFHLRVVGYRGAIPDECRRSSQPDTHRQILGHALNLLPFLPTNQVLLSSRQGSLANRHFPGVIEAIQRSGEWAAVNYLELRRNPLPLEDRIQLVVGTNEPALQICDHLLAKWQTSVRDRVPWPTPGGSLTVAVENVLQYFNLCQAFRGGFSALDIAERYSCERPEADRERHPLFAAYDGLTAAGEENWCAQDRDLIWLLLNEPDEGLYGSVEQISRLCYLTLEGRTRWPKHLPLTPGSFERYRAPASAYLRGTQEHLDRETVVFDSIRYEIGDFRTALRAATATVRRQQQET